MGASALLGSHSPSAVIPRHSNQEGHFNSVGKRKQGQVSARAVLSAQSWKSVEQSRSYCCFNVSYLSRKGSVGFSKWMIQMHLSIYICLGKIEIAGCNLICTFPPIPQPLFSCALLCVQWHETRWHLTLYIAISRSLLTPKSIICQEGKLSCDFIS